MPFPDTSPAHVREEGRHARDRGDPASANPYPEGSDEHATWHRAWDMPDGGAGRASGDPRAPGDQANENEASAT